MDSSYSSAVYNEMLSELFQQCTLRLTSEEEFNRIEFLKVAAELAPQTQARTGLLALYALYHFEYHRNFKKAI